MSITDFAREGVSVNSTHVLIVLVELLLLTVAIGSCFPLAFPLLRSGIPDKCLSFTREMDARLVPSEIVTLISKPSTAILTDLSLLLLLLLFDAEF
jgi:ABC-type enterobactin transport system permease subunit